MVFVDGLSSGTMGGEDALFVRRLRAGGLATIVVHPSAPPKGFDPDSVSLERRRSVIDSGVAYLIGLTHWLGSDRQTEGLAIGYFASDGAAAVALIAAADLGQDVKAVISVSGRPDFAGNALEWVQAPTLLVVAEDDADVVAYNEVAFDLLAGEKELEVLVGARRHADSAAVAEQVADLATIWLREHLSC